MSFKVADPDNDILDVARFKKAGAAEVGLRRYDSKANDIAVLL